MRTVQRTLAEMQQRTQGGHPHAGFQAACHSRRQELWHARTATLRGLLPQALGALTRALEGERPVPAAGQVRKACGRYGVPAPQGPTAPEDAVCAEHHRLVVTASAHSMFVVPLCLRRVSLWPGLSLMSQEIRKPVIHIAEIWFQKNTCQGADFLVSLCRHEGMRRG